MIRERVARLMMWKWLAEVYQEAGEVYKSKMHRIVALSLIPLGFLVAINNFSINSQQDPSCLVSCLADYSLSAIWLIVVPITGMALAVYYLDMKPTMMRKRMRKNAERA